MEVNIASKVKSQNVQVETPALSLPCVAMGNVLSVLLLSMSKLGMTIVGLFSVIRQVKWNNRHDLLYIGHLEEWLAHGKRPVSADCY